VIVPSGKTARPLWLYFALLYLFVLLAFLFYESEHRPTETVSPEAPLVHERSFMISPLVKPRGGVASSHFA